MSATYSYTINFNGASVINGLNAIIKSAGQAIGEMGGFRGEVLKMGQCAFAFNNITQGLSSMANDLNQAIIPGREMNKSLADLSAITGITGKGLKDIGKEAKKTAQEFGGSAAESVESYKLILSQLGPEIAKVPGALSGMGKNIATLSKTMNGDTTAAAEVLTTAMNQYQVSLEDPIAASKEMAKMMNVMAAAAKEGSAELPAQKAALEQSGMAAKMSNVAFEETAAAIQVLDKAGKKGSEGGVALRNVLSTLSQGRFLPKDIQEELTAAGVKISDLTDKNKTLSERLRPLEGIINDNALVTKLFGKENSNAALAIISGVDAMDEYKQKISGTNTAFEQAGVIMDTYDEKMARQKAFVDNLKISFFNLAKGVMPYLQGGVAFAQGTASVFMAINAAYCFSETSLAKAIGYRAKQTWKATTAVIVNAKTMLSSLIPFKLYSAVAWGSTLATYGLSKAVQALSKSIYGIPIIGWITGGISLIVGGISLLWNKFEGFRQVVFSVWEVIKTVFYNIGIVIKSIFDNIIKPYAMFWINLYKAVGLAIWGGVKWCYDKIVAGIQYVGEFFAGVWNWISEGASSLGESIVSAFNFIADPIKRIFTSVWDFVKNIFDKMIEKLKTPLDWIKGIWNKLFPKDKFKTVGEALQNGVQKGSESWSKSKGKDGKEIEEVDLGGLDLGEVNIPSVDDFVTKDKDKDKNKNEDKTTKERKQKESGGVVDLNNIKGSTNYSAIASKMAKVNIGGLSFSNTQKVIGENASIKSSNDTIKKINPLTEEYENKKDHIFDIAKNVSRIAACISLVAGMSSTPNIAGESVRDKEQISTFDKKSIRFEKFAEQIVINVPQGTTQDSAKAIMNELMKQLNNASV